jgi:hypothetical protein
MSSSFQLSPSHPIAHTSALAISAVGTALGLYALQSPQQFAAGWGLKREGRILSSKTCQSSLGHGHNISVANMYYFVKHLRPFG